MKALVFGIFLIFQPLFSTSVYEQNSFNRTHSFDVQHYRIGLRFDRSKKTVFGDAVVTLKALSKPLPVIELDAHNIDFKSISDVDLNSRLEYSYDKRTVRILPRLPLRPFETISIRFLYSARPKKGIYFVPSLRDKGKTVRPSQIWTQGEAEETHHWLPSFDFPDDKATTEQVITVRSDETVVGNGELVSNVLNKNGTRTFHYKMNVPHSIYLASFVVGKYQKVQDRYEDIPLGYYVYPGDEKVARNAFGKTKNMMRVFEELTGVDYPYNKYDQTIVAQFPFGGMENITATTFSDFEIRRAGALGHSIVQDLVAHELAHSWFGNLVTCRNWAELWINEAFASYMEAAYREKTLGRKNYVDKIADDATQYFVYSSATDASKHGLYNESADPGNDFTMFDPVTYNKGSAILHTLREEIGDRAFWEAINIHLTRFKFGNVETKDVRKSFEEASGRDLGWFFDQWIYRSGHPEIIVEQRFSRSRGELELVFSQTPVKSKNRLDLYRLGLDVEIKTSQQTFREKLELDEKTEKLLIKTKIKPEMVRIDKDYKIPIKDLSLRKLVITE